MKPEKTKTTPAAPLVDGDIVPAAVPGAYPKWREVAESSVPSYVQWGQLQDVGSVTTQYGSMSSDWSGNPRAAHYRRSRVGQNGQWDYQQAVP